MGKKSSDPVIIQPTPAPDPNELANQQLLLNRITQFGPTGELQFGTVNDAGDFVQNVGDVTGLADMQAASRIVPSEAQAGVLANTNAASLDLSALGSDIAGGLINNLPTFGGLDPNITNIDFSQISGLPQIGDFSEDALRLERSTFDQGFSRLDPVMRQREERLNQRLADQGLPVGSAAADAELDAASRAENDLLATLTNQSVGAGRAEQQRLFGNAMSVRGQEMSDFLTDAQLQNIGRATGFTEQAGERGAAFNELAALFGLNQVQTPGIGQFVQPGSVDVIGGVNANTAATSAANQAALGQAQIDAQQQSSTFGSLAQLGGTLGSAAIKMCDIELKTAMRPETVDILEKLEGLTVERWEYKDTPGIEHLGPYAGEFRKLFDLGNGKEIHIVDAFGVCLAGLKQMIEYTDQLEGRLAALEAVYA